MNDELLLLLLQLFLLFQNCDSQTLNGLETLWNGLPAPILYLPLTKQFGLNDAGPNAYSGQYSATRVDFANGPTGLSEAAIEVGGAADNQYVTVGNYSPLQFQDSGTSWTMTIFTKMASVGPILEFDHVDPSDTNYQSHLWMFSMDNQLFFNPVTAGASIESCTMHNSWNYVGVKYDSSSGEFKTLCDTSESAGISGVPAATKKLFIGYRDLSYQSASDGSQYTCLAIYGVALTPAQIQQVRQMCELWNQVITCPTQCAQDKCWPDLSQTDGYRCVGCNTGWSGTECDNRKFKHPMKINN